MIRLFVGLELSPEIIEALGHARGGVEGARWQKDEQFHLTLAFIGDVPNSTVRLIEGALAHIEFDPFDLAFSGVDMFGTRGQPKSLWAGVVDEAALRHLHEKILNALERVGVETDRRRYKPHTTLARFSRGATARIGDWLTVNSVLNTPTQRTGYFSLFSSQLNSDGASYVVEARFGEGAEFDGFEEVKPAEIGLQ